MYRLSRVLLAGLVMASFLIMPVGAWDKYSFVGDSVYFDQSWTDAQLYFVQSQAVNSLSTSSTVLRGQDWANTLSVSEGTAGAAMEAVYGTTYGSYVMMSPGTVITPSRAVSTSAIRMWHSWRFTVPVNPLPSIDSELQSIVQLIFGPSGFSGPGSSALRYCDFDMDLSSLGSFNAFSLDGPLQLGAYIFSYDTNSFVKQSYGGTLGVLVNGRLVHTFYPDDDGYINFADFVYSSAEPVTSISYRFTVPAFNRSITEEIEYGYGTDFYYDDTLIFSVLTGNSVLDGYVDNAQDSINSWDEIESGFGDSATSDFDDLGIDDFEYPSGFIGAFTLVSGIFSDLFNCMGDFRIIYILPLTLGVCFLLIGRVSRTSVPAPPKAPDLPVNAPALNAPKHPAKR